MPKKLLIVPDAHIPYHDERAWQVMMNTARWFKPNHIIDIGDLGDNYKISRHVKDPTREMSYKEENDAVREKRAELDDLGAENKDITLGNHENRLPLYLKEKAPDLYKDVTIDDLYKLTENDWRVTPYQQDVKIGQVYYTHDTGSSGHYTVKRALDDYQHSIVIGHHHRLDMRVEGNAKGKHQVGAQFGWLGDIEAVDYMHKHKVRRYWTLAFGLGYMQDNGVTHFIPCPIVNYTVSVEGKVISDKGVV